jgi:hypothetical protein
LNRNVKPTVPKEEEKKTIAAGKALGKEPIGAKKKDDDSDDPIAKSLAERIKAGGLTSVV